MSDMSEHDLFEPADVVRVESGSTPSRRLWLPRVIGGLLVIALLAAGAVVANAKWQDHERAVAHQKLLDRQDAYLAGLRRLDTRIGLDIAAPMRVLKSLTVPRPGDVIAARDAFANSENQAALAHDLAALTQLKPPAGWTAQHAALRHAVQEMRDAVAGMRDDRDSTDFDFLSTDLQSRRGGALASGLVDWQQTLTTLFRVRHQKAPAVVANAGEQHAPATLTSWVFGVDRACIAGNLRSDPMRPTGSVSQDAVQLRQAAADLMRTAADIRRVPVPRSDSAAIRRDVLDRMAMFDTEAKMLRSEADALVRHDFSAAQQAVDRMRTLVGALPLLEKGFRKYHAAACGGQSGSRAHRHVAT
jgi:hypothetical protein